MAYDRKKSYTTRSFGNRIDWRDADIHWHRHINTSGNFKALDAEIVTWKLKPRPYDCTDSRWESLAVGAKVCSYSYYINLYRYLSSDVLVFVAHRRWSISQTNLCKSRCREPQGCFHCRRLRCHAVCFLYYLPLFFFFTICFFPKQMQLYRYGNIFCAWRENEVFSMSTKMFIRVLADFGSGYVNN